MRRFALRSAGVIARAAVVVTLAEGAAAAADWANRGEGTALEAGTLVDGVFAGLLLRCGADGRRELRLTHNGAVFDRARDHTLVLSIDGLAFVSRVAAVASGRDGDDDFVRRETDGDLQPIVEALTRGANVEVSAPSGRYTLGLSGSSAALAPLADGCP